MFSYYLDNSKHVSLGKYAYPIVHTLLKRVQVYGHI